MRIAIVAAAVFIGAAASACADDEPEKGCDGSTYEIVECLKSQTVVWDRRMNAAYRQALEDAGPRQREQLRAAQRLWIKYRDANCFYYGLGEGTIARVEAGYCMKDLTKARARELEGKTEKH